MQQTTVFLLACALFGSTTPVASAQVSVRDYGAKGDDKTDDTGAFVAALRASRDVYVPEGVYQIGTVELSDQTWLHGAGRASVIRFVSDKDSQAAIYVGTECRVSNLRQLDHRQRKYGTSATAGAGETGYSNRPRTVG